MVVVDGSGSGGGGGGRARARLSGDGVCVYVCAVGRRRTVAGRSVGRSVAGRRGRSWPSLNGPMRCTSVCCCCEYAGIIILQFAAAAKSWPYFTLCSTRFRFGRLSVWNRKLVRLGREPRAGRVTFLFFYFIARLYIFRNWFMCMLLCACSSS